MTKKSQGAVSRVSRKKLEDMVWSHTHPDYRLKVRYGDTTKRSVMTEHALVPLDSLDVVELIELLPRTLREPAMKKLSSRIT